jgi:ribosomal protein S18 acetylase RimI-like enzyme
MLIKDDEELKNDIVKLFHKMNMEGKMIEYGILMENELLPLLELYQQLNPTDDIMSEKTAKDVWDAIKTQNIKYFVAKENGKIISSCYICIISNLTRGGKSIGYIENVITDTAYRRMGIGKTVVENAIEYAKDQNCYKVLLQSGNKRTEAHRFYESIGFDSTSKKAFEIRL